MTTDAPRLKIALVSAFPPGRQSLNEYGLHLAQGFAARDDVAEVVVIADRLPEACPELELGPKIRVVRCWRFNSPRAALSITRALRRERADGALFNIQTASFGDWEVPAALGLMAPALARLTGTPSGVLAHNLIAGVDLEATQLRGKRLRQAVTRLGGAVVTRALLSASYLSVTLEGYRKILARSHPGADVALIPHGTFDTERRDIGRNANRPMRIVTMGKFGTYKRLETLLAAFDLLRRRGFDDLELVIGGSDHPGTPGYLARLAQDRANDSRIRFAGYLPEDGIADFFANARVAVFDYESTTGSSGVLHQAASYGAVPVFPRIGDFVDLCRDEGLDGLHYDPRDAEGMADRIARLLWDPALADHIARANQRAALGMPFSAVIDAHMDLLRSAMARPEDAPRRKPRMAASPAAEATALPG